MFLADWIKHVTERDPAAPVRGRYASKDELVTLAGPFGLPRLFDRLLCAGGMVRTKETHLGDVAIVSIAGAKPCGAIRGERRFNVLASDGLSAVPVEGVCVIMAWTFNA